MCGGYEMPFDGAEFPTDEYVTQLDSVIDLLRNREQWVQGSFQTIDGRYCVRGAIRKVDASEALGPVILNAINEVTGSSYCTVETFNDHFRTDHELVLAVLMRARENVAAGRVAVTPQDVVPRTQWKGRWNNIVKRFFTLQRLERSRPPIAGREWYGWRWLQSNPTK